MSVLDCQAAHGFAGGDGTQQRRDRWLQPLGRAALVCGALSVVFVPAALVAVPLGLLTWGLAERDLAPRGAGCTDSRRAGEVLAAREDGAAGMAMGVYALALWGLLSLVLYGQLLLSLHPG